MSEAMNGLISGIGTILAMGGFLAVALWAYSSRRKGEFEAAARLALDEETPAPSSDPQHNASLKWEPARVDAIRPR